MTSLLSGCLDLKEKRFGFYDKTNNYRKLQEMPAVTTPQLVSAEQKSSSLEIPPFKQTNLINSLGPKEILEKQKYISIKANDITYNINTDPQTTHLLDTNSTADLLTSNLYSFCEQFPIFISKTNSNHHHLQSKAFLLKNNLSKYTPKQKKQKSWLRVSLILSPSNETTLPISLSLHVDQLDQLTEPTETADNWAPCKNLAIIEHIQRSLWVYLVDLNTANPADK